MLNKKCKEQHMENNQRQKKQYLIKQMNEQIVSNVYNYSYEPSIKTDLNKEKLKEKLTKLDRRIIKNLMIYQDKKFSFANEKKVQLNQRTFKRHYTKKDKQQKPSNLIVKQIFKQQYHIKNDFKNDIVSYSCQICGKIYNSFKRYQTHKKQKHQTKLLQSEKEEKQKNQIKVKLQEKLQQCSTFDTIEQINIQNDKKSRQKKMQISDDLKDNSEYQYQNDQNENNKRSSKQQSLGIIVETQQINSKFINQHLQNSYSFTNQSKTSIFQQSYQQQQQQQQPSQYLSQQPSQPSHSQSSHPLSHQASFSSPALVPSQLSNFSFTSKICLCCQQHFLTFQTLYRHIKNIHINNANKKNKYFNKNYGKITEKEKEFIKDVKKKAAEEMRVRMRKYNNDKQEVMQKVYGNRYTQQQMYKQNEKVFENNGQLKEQHTSHEQNQQNSQKYYQSQQQKLQQKQQQLFKTYQQCPYISEIQPQFQRQLSTLNCKQTIKLKKLSKFFIQCICHQHFSYIVTLIRHMRYKHLNHKNVDNFYLQYYKHKQTNVNYCKVTMIDNSEKMRRSLQRGGLKKVNLGFKENRNLCSNNFLLRLFNERQKQKYYEQGDDVVGFKQIGLHVRYLGTSTIQRFKKDCRTNYDVQYSQSQMRHVTICICQKIIFHVESIKRHMRITHGYVCENTEEKTKGWWRNQLQRKNNNRIKDNIKKYVVKTFCKGKVFFHKIQESKKMDKYIQLMGNTQKNQQKNSLFQSQAQLILHKPKKQQKLKIKDDFK